MIRDTLNVMRKEIRELARFKSHTKSSSVGLALFLSVFGVFLPLQTGMAWIESSLMLYFWVWAPLFLVSSVIADSIAGEKERNTLETLLASRLPDKAILFGKILASIWYGWGLAMISLVLGVVTINLFYYSGEIIFYTPIMRMGILVWSLLGAGLSANVGILVSLKAVTVRQAQQSLSISIMLLLFIPVFGVQALSQEIKTKFFNWINAFSLMEIVIGVGVVLLLLDIFLLRIAVKKFKREALILD